MIKLKISSVASETGALLNEYLEDRGTFNLPGDADICYGVSGNKSNSLNENCQTDKITRLLMMKEAKVSTVPWFTRYEDIPQTIQFPVLARNAYGHGGTDIVPVFQPEEIPWRIASGFSWFSEYIPIHTEYRVWVFRDWHLGTYKKVMRRPGEYKFIGRNFRNGFDFVYDGKPTRQAVDLAVNTIRCLGLDFGAVDMLLGKNGNLYVLECNTAPGVIRSGAQETLGLLADQMVAWAKGGFIKW
jgi:glutathione synthase/RimK-type ligase-like ATP-grasp enzyme